MFKSKLKIFLVFEYAWSVEPEMYVVEGPTLDDEGNLYFCPFSPKENVSLISLDGINGKRRWIIEVFIKKN